MLQARTLPPLATAGLALAGLGLIGMAAAELPGIPERLRIPAWALGILGGALATSALMPWLGNTIAARMCEARTVIAAGAMLGWVAAEAPGSRMP